MAPFVFVASFVEPHLQKVEENTPVVQVNQQGVSFSEITAVALYMYRCYKYIPLLRASHHNKDFLYKRKCQYLYFKSIYFNLQHVFCFSSKNFVLVFIS